MSDPTNYIIRCDDWDTPQFATLEAARDCLFLFNSSDKITCKKHHIIIERKWVNGQWVETELPD